MSMSDRLYKNMWEPCELCEDAKSMRGVVKVEAQKSNFECLCDFFDYCPICGRPLTEEAKAESLERIRKFSPCISCQHYNPDLLPDLPFECVACAMDSSSHYPKYTKITDAKEGE